MTSEVLPLPSATSPGHTPRLAIAPDAVLSWRRNYARRVGTSDVLVVTWAAAAAGTWRTSLPGGPWMLLAEVVGLVVAWNVALTVSGARTPAVLGHGTDEYKQVLRASFRLFGLLAIVAFVFQVGTMRHFVAVSFPLGTGALVLARWLWRQWLVAERNAGRCFDRVLVAGSVEDAADLVSVLHRSAETGLRVVAACTTGPRSGQTLPGTTVEIHGGIDSVPDIARQEAVDVVAVTASSGFSPADLRQLAWSLESLPTQLVVVPSLHEVTAHRLRTRLVDGLPMLHVEQPRFTAGTRITKRAFDVVGALIALFLLGPVLVAVAVAVKAEDGGPVLFRQTRVGHDGRRFAMLKFRSMVPDAEARIGPLAVASDGNGLLFKMRSDPRVTPLGRFLRRYSLDELPQLFNVLLGDMSLVGPRPPLPREVEHYDDPTHRRLLVKPGITGLWQISGRSDLSWEESVRLDLYYVENWSFTTDLLILAKTSRAVVSGLGAY